MRSLLLVFLCVHILWADSKELIVAQEAESRKDYTTAIQYYKKAAYLHDEAKAHYKLGIFYYQGKVVKRNYTQVYRSFTKASMLGHKQARYNLAIFYANQRTPYYDEQKAYRIFKELAVQGHAGAQNRLGMYLTFARNKVVDKDYKKAVKWFERSSKQGYESAHCNLAYMYASGKGVWQNLGRAHAFAKDGMRKGNPVCINVWNDYKLANYPEDKGFKFKFYNKPKE